MNPWTAALKVVPAFQPCVGELSTEDKVLEQIIQKLTQEGYVVILGTHYDARTVDSMVLVDKTIYCGHYTEVTLLLIDLAQQLNQLSPDAWKDGIVVDSLTTDCIMLDELFVWHGLHVCQSVVRARLIKQFPERYRNI